jgi:pilus assembly protein CpaC
MGAALALGFLSTGVPAAADTVSILSLQTGHSIILNTAGLRRVAVGNGAIAGVVPIGTSQIILNGKSPGHTTVVVWTDKSRTSYEVTVTEQSFDDIAKVLRSAINEPGVEIVAFGINLIIRGSVADVAAYNHVNDVVDRFKGIKFSGGAPGVIINAVSIAKPLGALQDDLAKVPGSKGLRVDTDPKGNVVVSGEVHDRDTAEQILDKVRGLAGPYLSSDGKVIDRLGVGTSSQIDVKCYVLEVDRNAASTLGINLQSATWGGGPINQGSSYTLAPPAFTFPENPQKVSGEANPFNVGPFARVSLLTPTLNLLLTEGHARILSAPDLVAMPGKQATFLVGGQIPIPVSNGLGTVSIVYKDYGVQLNVTPTLLGNGNVETQINPEISDLDFANGISLNGFTVPALKTSKLSTDVVTQTGESIVMGGLLRRVEQKNVQKIPLLGDLPILGQLFRSTQYQLQQSDVVFIMTPTVITR